ncbi:hypothetical protein BDN70DRAFT_896386 [Pholiota conissans]|uniref:Uncharacterized protein n=1 Tax=Pholiota conissans TaxID=109636 RepID=A0A9P6CS02_9AGAR|nr:hypothetical protein BDN70DRAFT_896386 [Pholiota conissans]
MFDVSNGDQRIQRTKNDRDQNIPHSTRHTAAQHPEECLRLVDGIEETEGMHSLAPSINPSSYHVAVGLSLREIMINDGYFDEKSTRAETHNTNLTTTSQAVRRFKNPQKPVHRSWKSGQCDFDLIRANAKHWNDDQKSCEGGDYDTRVPYGFHKPRKANKSAPSDS